MARSRNITLSVPDALLKRAKVLAVQRDTSLSALLTSYLEQIVADHDHYGGGPGAGAGATAPGIPRGHGWQFVRLVARGTA